MPSEDELIGTEQDQESLQGLFSRLDHTALTEQNLKLAMSPVGKYGPLKKEIREYYQKIPILRGLYPTRMWKKGHEPVEKITAALEDGKARVKNFDFHLLSYVGQSKPEVLPHIEEYMEKAKEIIDARKKESEIKLEILDFINNADNLKQYNPLSVFRKLFKRQGHIPSESLLEAFNVIHMNKSLLGRQYEAFARQLKKVTIFHNEAAYRLAMLELFGERPEFERIIKSKFGAVEKVTARWEFMKKRIPMKTFLEALEEAKELVEGIDSQEKRDEVTERLDHFKVELGKRKKVKELIDSCEKKIETATSQLKGVRETLDKRFKSLKKQMEELRPLYDKLIKQQSKEKGKVDALQDKIDGLEEERAVSNTKLAILTNTDDTEDLQTKPQMDGFEEEVGLANQLVEKRKLILDGLKTRLLNLEKMDQEKDQSIREMHQGLDRNLEEDIRKTVEDMMSLLDRKNREVEEIQKRLELIQGELDTRKEEKETLISSVTRNEREILVMESTLADILQMQAFCSNHMEEIGGYLNTVQERLKEGKKIDSLIFYFGLRDNINEKLRQIGSFLRGSRTAVDAMGNINLVLAFDAGVRAGVDLGFVEISGEVRLTILLSGELSIVDNREFMFAHGLELLIGAGATCKLETPETLEKVVELGGQEVTDLLKPPPVLLEASARAKCSLYSVEACHVYENEAHWADSWSHQISMRLSFLKVVKIKELAKGKYEVEWVKPALEEVKEQFKLAAGKYEDLSGESQTIMTQDFAIEVPNVPEVISREQTRLEEMESKGIRKLEFKKTARVEMKAKIGVLGLNKEVDRGGSSRIACYDIAELGTETIPLGNLFEDSLNLFHQKYLLRVVFHRLAAPGSGQTERPHPLSGKPREQAYLEIIRRSQTLTSKVTQSLKSTATLAYDDVKGQMESGALLELAKRIRNREIRIKKDPLCLPVTLDTLGPNKFTNDDYPALLSRIEEELDGIDEKTEGNGLAYIRLAVQPRYVLEKQGLTLDWHWVPQVYRGLAVGEYNMRFEKSVPIVPALSAFFGFSFHFRKESAQFEVLGTDTFSYLKCLFSGFRESTGYWDDYYKLHAAEIDEMCMRVAQPGSGIFSEIYHDCICKDNYRLNAASREFAHTCWKAYNPLVKSPFGSLQLEFIQSPKWFQDIQALGLKDPTDPVPVLVEGEKTVLTGSVPHHLHKIIEASFLAFDKGDPPVGGLIAGGHGTQLKKVLKTRSENERALDQIHQKITGDKETLLTLLDGLSRTIIPQKSQWTQLLTLWTTGSMVLDKGREKTLEDLLKDCAAKHHVGQQGVFGEADWKNLSLQEKLTWLVADCELTLANLGRMTAHMNETLDLEAEVKNNKFPLDYMRMAMDDLSQTYLQQTQDWKKSTSVSSLNRSKYTDILQSQLDKFHRDHHQDIEDSKDNARLHFKKYKEAKAPALGKVIDPLEECEFYKIESRLVDLMLRFYERRIQRLDALLRGVEDWKNAPNREERQGQGKSKRWDKIMESTEAPAQKEKATIQRSFQLFALIYEYLRIKRLQGLLPQPDERPKSGLVTGGRMSFLGLLKPTYTWFLQKEIHDLEDVTAKINTIHNENLKLQKRSSARQEVKSGLERYLRAADYGYDAILHGRKKKEEPEDEKKSDSMPSQKKSEQEKESKESVLKEKEKPKTEEKQELMSSESSPTSPKKQGTPLLLQKGTSGPHKKSILEKD